MSRNHWRVQSIDMYTYKHNHVMNIEHTLPMRTPTALFLEAGPKHVSIRSPAMSNEGGHRRERGRGKESKRVDFVHIRINHCADSQRVCLQWTSVIISSKRTNAGKAGECFWSGAERDRELLHLRAAASHEHCRGIVPEAGPLHDAWGRRKGEGETARGVIV